MASINIQESDIPSLVGKTAVITGGASGIGLGAAKILSEKGASIHILDINEPTAEDAKKIPGAQFHLCDTTDWEALRSAFGRIGWWVLTCKICPYKVYEGGSSSVQLTSFGA